MISNLWVTSYKTVSLYGAAAAIEWRHIASCHDDDDDGAFFKMTLGYHVNSSVALF